MTCRVAVIGPLLVAVFLAGCVGQRPTVASAEGASDDSAYARAWQRGVGVGAPSAEATANGPSDGEMAGRTIGLVSVGVGLMAVLAAGLVVGVGKSLSNFSNWH